MAIYKIEKQLLFTLSFSLLLAACSTEKSQEPETDILQKGILTENIKNLTQMTPFEGEIILTKRRAFIVENNPAFLADIPTSWRYCLSPVHEYTYYAGLVDAGKNYVEKNGSVGFIGKGEEDGEDNFFVISAAQGTGEGYFDDDFPIITEPFVFQDGTIGECCYQTREDYLKHAMSNIRKIYYEGFVRDAEKGCCIYFSMLQDEFDSNEQEITRFFESAYFSRRSLGISEEENILERELLDLHIWNRYMRLSLQVPEGSAFERREFNNVEGYRTCSYTIYLDTEKKIGITVESDQGAVIAEPTGDYTYYLNVEDFEETVYELSGKNNYYFPNYNMVVRTWGGDEEQQAYLKRIVQSIRFE